MITKQYAEQIVPQLEQLIKEKYPDAKFLGLSENNDYGRCYQVGFRLNNRLFVKDIIENRFDGSIAINWDDEIEQIESINLDDLEFRFSETTDIEGNYGLVCLIPGTKEGRKEYFARVDDIFNGTVTKYNLEQIPVSRRIDWNDRYVFKLQPFLVPRLLVALNNLWDKRGKENERNRNK